MIFFASLVNIGEVDILVGLPTHNNAKTIGSIVNTIRTGILRAFRASESRSLMSTLDRAMALPTW